MSITLDETQQALLTAEASHFAEATQSAELQQTYRALQTSASKGEVPAELLEPLGGLLDLGLATGRIRALHGAHHELAAGKLFRRTPQGQALQEAVSQANNGLEALEGHVLEQLSISARGPGHYTLTIRTALCRLVLQLGAGGVEVRSVEFSV